MDHIAAQLITKPASLICSSLCPGCFTSEQALYYYSGRSTEDDSNMWVPVTHVRDPKQLLASGFWSTLDPATCGQLWSKAVNTGILYFSVSL